MREMLALGEAPKGYISPSQIGMMMRCEYQFFLRYVKGLKVPPSFAMVAGDAAHYTIESSIFDDDVRRRSGEFFNEEVLRLDKEVESKYDEEIDKNDYIAATAEATEKYIGEHIDSLLPGGDNGEVHVEEQVDANIIGLDKPIKIVYDYRSDKKIVDWKLTKRKASSVPLQLRIYKAVAGRPVEMHNIVRTTKLTTSSTILPVQDVDMAILVEELSKLVLKMRTGIFTRCNNPMVCGWCGYREMCKPII